MKYLFILLFLFPFIAYAASLNVYQGGTGRTDVPVAGYLYGNDQNKLLATSSPTFGWVTATSTSGTSTFQNVTILGTCTGCGGVGSTPGGASTQIQYNNGNVFDARSLFTFDNSTGNVTIGGDLFVNGADLNLGTGLATSTLTSATGVLGIATSVPGTGKLEVGGGGLFKGNLEAEGTTSASSLIATSTLSVGTSSPLSNNRFTVDGMSLLAGHIETQGPPPSISSCGTSPTIAGNDQVGKITIGSGTISSCVLTFANAWKNTPVCMADEETAILLVRSVTTNTTLTLSVATTFNGDTVDYMCLGFK